jgi:Protein of unknown function (DUF2934)
MPSEEQIKEMAFAIWEKEGYPEGKDVEHYFRAKQILEAQKAAQTPQIAPKPRALELAGEEPPLELAASPKPKKKNFSKRKNK